MTTTNLAQVIADLRANVAASRAKLAAIPDHACVIIWHDVPLRITGDTIAIHGRDIYWGSYAQMQRDAQGWNAKDEIDRPAVVMTKAQALAHTDAKDAAMLAGLPTLSEGAQ